MSYRYLLVAEADKIQDVIFRSSRLREVVGASQLLVRFCQDGVRELLRQNRNQTSVINTPVINDAGSFRVIFEHSDENQACEAARRFAADLAEYYRLVFGSTISIAEPVCIQSDFRQANEHADTLLRQAKRTSHGVAATIHMPYVAFCASCGIALAESYGHLPGEQRTVRPRYLCSSCTTKAQERKANRGPFLDEFLHEVTGKQDVTQYECPHDTDDVACFDPRNYVAYLIADGNNMGKIFGQLDEETIRTFSAGLTPALRKSLAEPAQLLWKQLSQSQAKPNLVPVLPLILGGDDLFALLPAPYALDVARRFCLAYEKHVDERVQQCGVQEKPTIAAAVVICKSKYPYTLAHRRAEYLLKETKRLCKRIKADGNEPVSMVNFDVILGNRITSETSDLQQQKGVILTLRPYLVREDGTELSDALQKYGIEMNRLLEQRLALKNVPRTRLAALENHFEKLQHDVDTRMLGQEVERWTQQLEPLLSRSEETNKRFLCKSFEQLGQPCPESGSKHNWRMIRRGEHRPLAHGLPDVLHVWQFAQNLDHSLSEYENEAEEDTA